MHKYKKRSAIILLSFLAVLLIITFGIQHFNKNENKAFKEYTHALFRQELSGNTISLHYTLKNPAAYGIRDTSISIGSYPTDTTSICMAFENALALLRSHDRSHLSKENRLTYDVLEDYYTKALELAPYSLYEEPLAPLTGTQSQLPIVLSEYQFYTPSDIDTYLELLTKVPQYFDSVIDFEKARAEKGFLMSDKALKDLVKECQAFVNMKSNNYLYSTFKKRLDEMDDTRVKDKDAYIKKNSDYIKKYIFPAYEHLAAELKKLNTATKNSAGLCSLPNGQHYYEMLVASETGSDRTVSELQALTRAQIVKDFGDMQTALIKTGSNNASKENADSPTSDLYSSQGALLPDSNPISILTTLQRKMKSSFPKPPAVDVQVKYVQKSMEDYLSPAFYMIPAIDNTKNNVIYINPGHLPDDLSLFTTLAHEGYPGHLYQNVYYMSLKPDPIRCLLNYGGYTEGWATYTEMISYYYSPLSREDAVIMQKNTSILLGLYALADMGIHHDGWTLRDTIKFFNDYGITDSDAIHEIYELIAVDPSNYLKYYIGYLEFLELKKYAIQTWGNSFSQKRFHEVILKTGPAPFPIIKKQLES